jgi:hypothetical protein
MPLFSSTAEYTGPLHYSSYGTTAQLKQPGIPARIVQAAPEVNDPPLLYYTMGPSLTDHISKFFLDVSAQAPNTWAPCYLRGPDGYMMVPYFKFAQNEELELFLAQLQEAIFAEPLMLSQPSGSLDAP